MDYNRRIVLGFLRHIAETRDKQHAGKASARFLGDSKTTYMGMVGEWDFSMRTNLPIDLSLRYDGDHGIDFVSEAGTIDVKTYLKPYNLLCEVDKKAADILVLAKFSEDGCLFLGWEWSSNMYSKPIRRFHDKGPLNHFKAADELNKMHSLYRAIGIQ